jgi:hypothetical protein
MNSTIQSQGTGQIDITLQGTSGFTAQDMTLDTGPGGNLAISSDKIAWSGATTVKGTAALIIQPITTTAITIGLGGGVGDLNLDDTELGFLQDGFTGITIGRSTAGVGQSRVGKVDKKGQRVKAVGNPPQEAQNGRQGR